MIDDLGIVVAAGGSSGRYGKSNKLFEPLAGQPVFIHCIKNFLEKCPAENILLAVPEHEMAAFAERLSTFLPEANIKLIAGGETRMRSVMNGLAALPSNVKIAAVHDAARPLASSALLKKCYETARKQGGAVAAKPVSDTIKTVDADGLITGTVERSMLWAMETPQVFPRKALEDACKKALKDGKDFTDDAGVMEYSGNPAFIVNNPEANIKITYSNDLLRAESHMQKSIHVDLDCK